MAEHATLATNKHVVKQTVALGLPFADISLTFLPFLPFFSPFFFGGIAPADQGSKAPSKHSAASSRWSSSVGCRKLNQPTNTREQLASSPGADGGRVFQISDTFGC
jgi:hypothetical protein